VLLMGVKEELVGLRAGGVLLMLLAAAVVTESGIAGSGRGLRGSFERRVMRLVPLVIVVLLGGARSCPRVGIALPDFTGLAGPALDVFVCFVMRPSCLYTFGCGLGAEVRNVVVDSSALVAGLPTAHLWFIPSGCTGCSRLRLAISHYSR
jgi:hypothetical protein